MNGRTLIGLVWMAAATGMAGCATDSTIEPLPPPPPECTGPVTVTVAFADTVPVFSWAPRCALARLIVEQGFDEYWGTETLGPNTYVPPIVYDINPPNSAPEEPARPLERGLTYRVSVWRFFTVTPESLQLLGETTFDYPHAGVAAPGPRGATPRADQ